MANLVGLLSKHLAVQGTEAGTDIDELKPAAGHTAAGVYIGDHQWHTFMFRKGDDIFDPVVVSNAMKKLVGEGAGSKEYPGIHAGSSEVGSEGKDSGASKVPPPHRNQGQQQRGRGHRSRCAQGQQ